RVYARHLYRQTVGKPLPLHRAGLTNNPAAKTYHNDKFQARSHRDSGYRHKSSRSEEHTSELQSREKLVCRLLLEKKNKNKKRLVTQSQHVGSTVPNTNVR